MPCAPPAPRLHTCASTPRASPTTPPPCCSKPSRRPNTTCNITSPSSPEETAAFVFTLDAINFGSGYFPHLRKRPELSGYFTIAGALTDHFRAHGPLSAPALATIDAAACQQLFDQPPDGGRSTN
ncbi:MAG: hypothetical protein U0841_10845 [Chloroflexia bacterium]